MSWITELLNRFQGDERQRFIRPQPGSFEVTRPRYDPSSFYRDLQQIRSASQRATQETMRLEEQKRLAALQAIPQTGIVPEFPAPSRLPESKFGAPLTDYRLTSGYGHRQAPTKGAGTFHRGVDLSAPHGTSIYATHEGVVASSGWSNGYGWNITLNGGSGLQSFYGHNSRNVVKPGERVKQGQLIGYVGSTGISTGPHLHYGIMINGQWINPQGYF